MVNTQLNREALAADRVSKAKIALLSDAPFFGTLSMHLGMIPSGTVPTMSTNGHDIYYGIEFVLDYDRHLLPVVIAHELGHVAFGHPLRRGNRDPQTWNEAADHVVNNVLLDAGYTPLPDWLCDRQYAGMSAEEVYDLLKQDQADSSRENDPQQPEEDSGDGDPQSGDSGRQSGAQDSDSGHDSCPCGMIDPDDAPDAAEDMTEAERQQVLQDMQQTVARAAIAADFAGNLPGHIQETIRASREAAVDWRTELSEFFETNAKNDYCWTQPNRRFLQNGIILPSTQSKEMGEAAVFIDSSGSIDTDALSLFTDELSAVLDDIQPERVHVLCIDTEVQSAEEYEPIDLPLRIDVKGRFGTDFRSGFAWLDAHGIEPAVVVYFTDLQCSKYPEEPDYPVLWVSPRNVRRENEPRFGRHIVIRDD